MGVVASLRRYALSARADESMSLLCKLLQQAGSEVNYLLDMNCANGSIGGRGNPIAGLRQSEENFVPQLGFTCEQHS